MGGENSLKLIVEEGPLKGQTVGFKPGMRVQIGRVVHGNTLSIRDAGISSKHLLICFDSELVSCWTISDLGSPNGTLLNKLKLDPCTPTQLTDEDVIEIGELTSIKVKFEQAGSGEVLSKVRGNAHRLRGRKVAAVNENEELKLRKDENDQNAKDQSRRGKGVSKSCEVSKSKELIEEQMVSVKRLTRRSLEQENGVEGKREKMANLQQKAYLSRNRYKKGKLEEYEEEDGYEMENVGAIEAKDGETVSPRRLRSVKKVKVSRFWGNLGVNEVGQVEGKGGQPELRRITRSMTKAQRPLHSGGMKSVLPTEVKGGKNVSLKRQKL